MSSISDLDKAYAQGYKKGADTVQKILTSKKFDEIDEIILKPAEWQEDNYRKARTALNTLIEDRCRRARIEGEIKGLSTFALRDRKSFRVNSSILSIDSKDILKDIADCYDRLTTLKKESSDES
jgi:hypothetical protein